MMMLKSMNEDRRRVICARIEANTNEYDNKLRKLYSKERELSYQIETAKAEHRRQSGELSIARSNAQNLNSLNFIPGPAGRIVSGVAAAAGIAAARKVDELERVVARLDSEIRTLERQHSEVKRQIEEYRRLLHESQTNGVEYGC